MRKSPLTDFSSGNDSQAEYTLFIENLSETIFVWVSLNGIKLFVPKWESKGG